MDDLPADIWGEAGLGDIHPILARVPDMMATLERDHGAPRAEELLRRHVAETLPGGKIHLYGAGMHTRLLLSLLKARPDIEVLGIVDRLSADIKTLEGLPVLAPEALTGRTFDYLLIGHTSYEPEMLRRVRAAGIDSARCRVIYGDPAFRRAAGPWVERLLAPLAGRRFEALIVETRTALLPERDLATLFAPERTLSAHFGRAFGTAAGDGFESIDLAESLDALRALIARIRPRVVYLQPTVYKNFLVMAVKHWFPRLPVITEFYDCAILWRDEDLEHLFGLDGPARALLRAAERVAFQQAALCISKRGGPSWDRVRISGGAPYQMIFPMLTAPAAGGPATGQGGPDLVYAGFLPAPVMLARFNNGYNFLTVLEEVCRRGGLTAEIYNAAHVGASADQVLGDYLRAYPGPPVHYRRRLDYGALVERMAGARYGWLCDSSDFQADRVVGVCNRWTGYVSAGLPVLLDGSWRFMADLVRRFGAGAVVGCSRPDEILAAIAATDAAAARAGVLRLRGHLFEHNARALAVAREVAARALASDPWDGPG